MTKLSTLILILFALISGPQLLAQELTPAHQDSLKQLVDSYYKINLKIYQKNSTVSDIDDLFDLFTEDFVYVHPKYGGAYPRQDLYEGYVRNQNNGAYNGSIVDVSVKNMITGLNAAATDRVYFKKGANGKREEIDPGMTLFEFKNGKISKIFEYW